MADITLITGPIGAGKSTLVKYLAKKDFKHILQPKQLIKIQEEFVDPVAPGLFYEDPRWAPIVDPLYLKSRLVRHGKAKQSKDHWFFDRGILEGRFIFALNAVANGHLSGADLAYYDRQIRKAIHLLDAQEQDTWLEKLIVYLKVEDPQILYNRVQKRGQEGDEGVTLPYLRQLNERYELFLKNIDKIYAEFGLKAPKVLVVDASIDSNGGDEYLEEISQKVMQKLEEMSNGN